jgi:chromosome segregation ATPase
MKLENDRINKNLTDSRAEMDSLKRMLNDMEFEHKFKDSEIVRFQLDNKERNKDIVTLNSEIVDLKQTKRELSDKLRLTLSDYDMVKDSLATTKNDLRGTKDSLHKRDDTIASLKNDLVKKDSELIVLDKNLTESEDRCRELSSKIDQELKPSVGKLSVDLKSKDGDLTEERAKNGRLAADLEKCKGMNLESRKEITRLEATIKGWESSVHDLTNYKKRIEDELDAERENNHKKALELSKTRNEMDSALNRLETEQNVSSNLESNLNNEKNAYNDVKNSLGEQIEDLLRKLTDLEISKRDLSARVEELESDLEISNTNLQAKIQDLETLLAKAAIEKKTAETELAAALEDLRANNAQMLENEEKMFLNEDKMFSNEAKMREYEEVINLATKNIETLQMEKEKLNQETAKVIDDMDKQKFAHGKVLFKYAMLLMEFERLYIQKHGDIGVLDMKPPSPGKGAGKDPDARRKARQSKKDKKLSLASKESSPKGGA